MRVVSIAAFLILTETFVSFAKEPAGLNVSDLTHLEWLMYRQPGRTLEISSYDRTGGNNDGNTGKYSYTRIDKNGEYVVMESHKPGAIVQIWFTNLSTAGHIHFYFDGSARPQIDMDIHDFFSGKRYPFIKPVVEDDTLSSGGFVCFLPMPYHSSCKITTTGIARYYHIIYREFSSGDSVTTFALPLDSNAMEELRLARRDLEDVGDSIPTGCQNTTIPAGQTKTVWSANGREYITGLFMRPDTGAADVLKKLIVRIYWDGAQEPSVESPLLDFFGDGFRAASYRSLPTGYAKGEFYSRFPMPFRRSARIEIENGNTVPVALACDVRMDALLSANDSTLLYFHAQFRQDTSVEHVPITILETRGEGHFVGMRQTMQSFPGKLYNPDSGRSRIDYLEGDETVYVDGDTVPSWHGTGTEDEYDGGWYFKFGTFSLPFNGCLEKSAWTGSISAYRFQVTDMIPFTDNFKMFIEHGGWNNRPGVYYSTVAYWYQTTDTSEAYRPLLAADLSLPLRAVWKEKGVEYFAEHIDALDPRHGSLSILPWNEASQDWKGISDVVFKPADTSGSVSLVLNPPISGKYEIDMQYTTLPSGGKFVVKSGDSVVSDTVDSYGPDFNPGQELHWTAHLKRGHDTITVSAADPDRNSEGNEISLTSYDLKPMPEGQFVSEWKVVGPFDDSGFRHNRKLYGPERDLRFNRHFKGIDGKYVSWRTAHADSIGTVNLIELFKKHDYTIAYAGTRIFSPVKRKIFLFAGSDDGLKIYLNGHLVWINLVARGLVKDQDRVLVTLPKGWSTLTMEITQGIGDWAFALRLPEYRGKRVTLR